MGRSGDVARVVERAGGVLSEVPIGRHTYNLQVLKSEWRNLVDALG